jgi:type IV pilus assembly protein PilQ
MNDPPRIVLDFFNTQNGLGKSVLNTRERDLNGTNIIQTDRRTRLVVKLNRMLSYNTKIE